MSYDLQVWSVTEPDWRRIVAGLDGWEFSDNSLTYHTGSWVINVVSFIRVEVEDIPEEIFTSLPGIQYLTEMNLEPTHAPKIAYKLFKRVATLIAKDTSGVILDPQEGSITTPRGVKRNIQRKKLDRISVLEFGWWFTESELIDQGGFRKFFTILELYLPEVLPRRYGKITPPQYSLAEHGKDHFFDFVANETLSVVWYPYYPVLHVWLGVFDGFGPRKQGYRTNSLNIMVDAIALAQPGWDVALQRMWHETSDFIRPFYGEVRVLGDYMLRGGSLYSDIKTDEHPIKNGWWKGIPKSLGLAVVIGERYADLWPKFVKRSERRNGLFYASIDDWASGKTVKNLVGRVPRGIAQPPWRGDLNAYPKKWPFEYPFTE